MTKAALIAAVSERTGLSRREVAEAVEAVLREVKETLESGKPVKIVAFGSFQVRQKRERMGRHPQTAQAIVIAPRTVVSFKPSRFLREVVNAGETL